MPRAGAHSQQHEARCGDAGSRADDTRIDDRHEEGKDEEGKGRKRKNKASVPTSDDAITRA